MIASIENKEIACFEMGISDGDWVGAIIPLRDSWRIRGDSN